MGLSESFERRVGFNEATFRSINECIEHGDGASWDPEVVGFPCADYEAVRAHPQRFLVAPGDIVPERPRPRTRAPSRL